MQNILLLREELSEICPVRDYMQLSGFHVFELAVNQREEYWKFVGRTDVILLECGEVEPYLTFCTEIRNSTKKPILVISPSNGEWGKVRMLLAGADDYIVVPCMQTELVARIQSHINCFRRLTKTFAILELQDMSIDAIHRQVTVRGKRVSLRLKEFDVLLYLAQNSNEIVTKEQIYRNVWKDKEGGDYYNTVVVHVKRIREKLEKNPEVPRYIETIWGIGYRFNEVRD
jgi:DNA-binding response OmpR family regulator